MEVVVHVNRFLNGANKVEEVEADEHAAQLQIFSDLHAKYYPITLASVVGSSVTAAIILICSLKSSERRAALLRIRQEMRFNSSFIKMNNIHFSSSSNARGSIAEIDFGNQAENTLQPLIPVCKITHETNNQ